MLKYIEYDIFLVSILIFIDGASLLYETIGNFDIFLFDIVIFFVWKAYDMLPQETHQVLHQVRDTNAKAKSQSLNEVT